MGDMIAGAVGGIMGGAGGYLSADYANKAKGATASNETRPWAEQAPYLTYGFEQAQQNYQDKSGTPWYSGPLYNTMNDTQTGAIAGMGDWMNQYGNTMTSQMAQMSGTGAQAGNQFAGNAGQFAQGNFNAPKAGTSGLDGGYKNAGYSAMTNSDTFANNAKAMAGMAASDPTSQNIERAGQYANNPALDGAIDASLRDVERNLGQQKAGLNRMASAGGGLNSSRAGMAEAMAERDAMDRAADISSSMRADAYTQGLNLAEGARVANNNTSLAANNQLGQNASMGFSAMSDALDNFEGSRQFDTTAQLQGNAQLGQAGQLGINAAQTANGIQMGNQAAMLAAGSQMQQDQNNANQAALTQWQMNDQRQAELLQQYWNIVGASGWGSKSDSVSKGAKVSPWGASFQGAVGGASAMMGAYSDWTSGPVMSSGGAAPSFDTSYNGSVPVGW